MSTSQTYPRLNIYLDSGELRRRIKIAAASAGVSLSAWCLQAIRARLQSEGESGADAGDPAVGAAGRPGSPVAAAEALDRLRRQIGPIGVPVSELIQEGRRR